FRVFGNELFSRKPCPLARFCGLGLPCKQKVHIMQHLLLEFSRESRDLFGDLLKRAHVSIMPPIQAASKRGLRSLRRISATRLTSDLLRTLRTPHPPVRR